MAELTNETNGTLQARLDEITAQTRMLVQPERLAVTDAAVAELHATGIEERILPVGAQAPGFALTDAVTGKIVRSEDLLALGPLVVVFFRGRWCPYCMTTLEAWQEAYAEVRAKGALLVAISPQVPRQNDFAVQQHHLTYPLLTDTGARVAAEFGLAYTVSEAMQKHYRSILVNVPFVNGDESWQLPLAATYVIGQDGKVRFAEANAEHRVRTEPAEVLRVLG